MKHCLKILFATMLVAFSLQGFSAVKVVECEDEQGGRSFQQNCPPGSTQVGSKKFSTGGSGKEGNSPVVKATLYAIPECGECDEVREFLQAKNVSISEKNADESIEIQNELTEISGDLKVPTIVIGEEVIIGYKRSEIEEILLKANDEEAKPSTDNETTK